MHQVLATLSSVPEIPVGTGGFLNPEKVAGGFGIKEGMKISDFGCGAGYLTIIMAEKTGPEGNVYAFDVQENPLDTVKAKARALGLKNVEAIRANLEIPRSSGLEDNSQDIVLLANILFQSNKKPEIIREAVRVLAKGGRLVIIDWKKGVNSFGPPEERKSDVGDMIKIAEPEGVKLENPIDAGSFHFGLIFKKI